jgi:hypothetical protein
MAAASSSSRARPRATLGAGLVAGGGGAVEQSRTWLYNRNVVSAHRPSRKPQTWLAYRIRGAKAELLGHVYAPTMEGAIAAAAAEYRVPASRILVQQVSGA